MEKEVHQFNIKLMSLYEMFNSLKAWLPMSKRCPQVQSTNEQIREKNNLLRWVQWVNKYCMQWGVIKDANKRQWQDSQNYSSRIEKLLEIERVKEHFQDNI